MSKFQLSEPDNDGDSDNSELGGITDALELITIDSDQAVAGQDSLSSTSSPPKTSLRPDNPLMKYGQFQGEDEPMLPSKKRIAMKSKTLLKPITMAPQGEASRLMIRNKSREDLIGENRKKKKQMKRTISTTSLSSVPDDDSDITLSDSDELIVDDIIDEPAGAYTDEMLSDHLSSIYALFDKVEPKLQKKLIEKLENTLKSFRVDEIQYQQVNNLINTLDPEHFYGKKDDKKRTRVGGSIKRKRNKKTKRTKKAIYKKRHRSKNTKKRKTRKTKKRKKTLKKQH